MTKTYTSESEEAYAGILEAAKIVLAQKSKRGRPQSDEFPRPSGPMPIWLRQDVRAFAKEWIRNYKLGEEPISFTELINLLIRHTRSYKEWYAGLNDEQKKALKEGRAL